MARKDEGTFLIDGIWLISIFPSSEGGYDFCTFKMQEMQSSFCIDSGIYTEAKTLNEGLVEAYISATANIAAPLCWDTVEQLSEYGFSAETVEELIEMHQEIAGVLLKI